MVIKWEVDPGERFRRAVQRAGREVEDLTVPLTLIAQSWYKSNIAIFQLRGPGKYEDLSENYKPDKQAAVGFLYPILKRHGALAKSITEPGSKFSISKIINKRELILGSSIPYGAAHQYGTKRMPRRPWVLIGAEQTAPPELNRRLDAWVTVLADYVRSKTAKHIGEPG